MKQDDPQFKLRLKPELKERLEGSAKESTRTLGAEIVARLENSFKPQAASTNREVELLLAAVHTQFETLDLKVQLITSRLESLRMRSKLIQFDSERLTESAKTDADFARVGESIEQLKAVEEESDVLKRELVVVLDQQASMNKQYQDMSAMVSETRAELEKRFPFVRKTSHK